MATVKRRSRTDRRKGIQLSDSQKTALVVAIAAVVLLAGGYWVFDMLMAPAKPDAAVASTDQIADYLGHRRGFERLSVDNREKYLVEIIRACDTPEKVAEMSRALDRLPPSDKQRFLDATFEIGKERFMVAAKEYTKLPQKKRRHFVDDVIDNFDNFAQRIATNGTGPTGFQNSLASPFKNHIPDRSDEWHKMIIARTTPSERAKAKPLADALMERVDERHSQSRVR
jgi:hypothetical protein